MLMGGLMFVGAAVAESGAVPASSSGDSRLIGQQAAPIFLGELLR